MLLFSKKKNTSPTTQDIKLSNAIHHIWANIDFYIAAMRAKNPNKKPFYLWLEPFSKDEKINKQYLNLINQLKKTIPNNNRVIFLNFLIHHQRSVENGYLGNISNYLRKNNVLLNCIIKNLHNLAIDSWYEEVAGEKIKHKRNARISDKSIKEVSILLGRCKRAKVQLNKKLSKKNINQPRVSNHSLATQIRQIETLETILKDPNLYYYDRLIKYHEKFNEIKNNKLLDPNYIPTLSEIIRNKMQDKRESAAQDKLRNLKNRYLKIQIEMAKAIEITNPPPDAPISENFENINRKLFPILVQKDKSACEVIREFNERNSELFPEQEIDKYGDSTMSATTLLDTKF